MANQVLIIHGWSDTSTSFRSLAGFLNKHGYEPKVLWLGDYISKDDDVRVEDVAKRMAEVIDEMMASGELNKSFDMIVHSTGGLVSRAWLTSRYRGEVKTCPLKRLVMLAPANYGSKLAATGKSFLGRIVKGYDNWFQSGEAMLSDLELSSQYQWDLAQRDILIVPGADSTRYYGKELIWPFVIVGTHPYTNFLRQVVNEDGSDGTVRVCAANLNARGITIDFRQGNEENMFTEWGSRLECDVPLAVLPTRTHGSIIDPERLDRDNREDITESLEEQQVLGDLILEALGCADFNQYQAIQAKWEQLSEQTADRRMAPPSGAESEYFHQYLQINSHVIDDYGIPVNDYFLEFFSNKSRKHDDANVYLHARVIEDVKKNSISEALRNLYFDRTDLYEGYYDRLPNKTDPTLFMSISVASPGKNISYFEREKEGAGQYLPVHLKGDKTNRWLKRNTTHFVRIIIPRRPGRNVFKLTNYNSLVK